MGVATWFLVLVGGVVGVIGGVSLNALGNPNLTPSQGYVWPRPQMVLSTDNYVIVRPDVFKFTTVGFDCNILQEALKRYQGIMFFSPRAPKVPKHLVWLQNRNFHGYLDEVSVNLLTACEDLPYTDMDESYEIKVDSPGAPGVGTIISQSIWGALRGLETFSQLLVPSGTAYAVNSTQIMDFPRFPYRGLMLDTARHYLPLTMIFETLDLMAMNKFNVFHWHIVDDQSFPYQSGVFPDLSKLGSWVPTAVYTAADIVEVVEYARLRGIRVLPEFDTPGHTQSWGPGQPGLLTECYNKQGEPDGTYGPIDPSKDANYAFLTTLLTEITSRFPDHYIHLGGDEVDFTCWKSNPNLTAFMASLNITGDYTKLEEVYITKLIDIVSGLPTKNGYLVWQEVFDNGVKIAPDTVVHVWKNEGNPPLFKKELNEVTEAGYRAVLSSCWYLNYISYGIDWHPYYECDPSDFNGTAAQARLVMGGEACMWAEFVDATNLTPRLWPRASVVAEKLWSSATATNSTGGDLNSRLDEHRCRLLKRGYDAEPLWPGYCDLA